jgi:hypothetical protein
MTKQLTPLRRKDIETGRKQQHAKICKAIEVELSMCGIANDEASSEWFEGFEFAWKRVRLVLEDKQ